MRTPHGRFVQYHTSADDLNFVHPRYLEESLVIYSRILDVLDSNRTYVNQNPKCEPHLGKRGLYGNIGGQTHGKAAEIATLWVLNLSDGNHSLMDIAVRSGLEFPLIKNIAETLLAHGLLQEVSSNTHF
jgi:aminopeptidase-like protein